MTKKKSKRKLKKYIIDVRVDMSYTTEIEATANNILEAGKMAMRMGRCDAAYAVPSDATFNHVNVEIEDGVEVVESEEEEVT